MLKVNGKSPRRKFPNWVPPELRRMIRESDKKPPLSPAKIRAIKRRVEKNLASYGGKKTSDSTLIVRQMRDALGR